MIDHCLGIELLGYCNYDPSSPGWRIISLGDTIAAIALIITFTQLLTLNLRVRIKYVFSKIYLLWGLGVIAIFISSLLPLIPGNALPLLGYPVFWELIGATFLLIGISILIYQFNSTIKFSKKNVKKLKELIVRVIGTGNEKDHIELAISLKPILKAIVSYANKFDSFEASLAKRENRKYFPDPLSVEAGRILNLCSDQKFCSAVVTREPGFAIVLFEEIKKKNAYNSGYFKPLVWELIRQAFINKESILYREEKYRGLGFTAGFTFSAFNDHEFVENLQPLAGFEFSLEKEVTSDMLDRYTEILEYITKSYLAADRFYEHSFAFYTSINKLVEYSKYSSLTLDSFNSENLYRSHPTTVLRASVKALSSTLDILSSSNDSEFLKDDYILFHKNTDPLKDYSPYRYLANWLYDLMEALSHTQIHDQALRSILIGLWMKAYPHTTETNFHKEIQWRFEKKLFERLRINLEEGYYPAVTRPLIWILGLEQDGRSNGEGKLKQKFFEYLKKTFVPLYERDKEAALDKLPVGVSFDYEKRQLKQFVRKGDERVLNV